MTGKDIRCSSRRAVQHLVLQMAIPDLQLCIELGKKKKKRFMKFFLLYESMHGNFRTKPGQ